MDLTGWLYTFMLTALVEVPIVVWLTRDVDMSLPRRSVVAVFGQLGTHPLVWFVFPFVPRLTGWETFLLSEGWAWAAEALLYAEAIPGLGARRALGIAAVANGMSVVFGLIILR
jgi:hypothetical protein